MNIKQILMIISILALVLAFFIFDGAEYFSLTYIKQQQLFLENYTMQHPIQITVVYFLLYVIITGLSLPGATILGLLAGALFGVVWGSILVSFASTLGATIAFLMARFLFYELVQTKFAHYLQAINQGIIKEGAFYLFSLRLVPLFPFFVINLVMGVTPIKLWTYVWVSQIGMLAGTIVYVNAGTQLAKIESASGLLSPELLISFALLGLFPLVAKKSLTWFHKSR